MRGRVAALLMMLAATVPLTGCLGARKAPATAAVPPPPPLETVSVPPPSHPMEPQPEIATLPDGIDPAPMIPLRRPPPLPRLRALPPPPAQTASVAPVDLGQLTTGPDAGNAAVRQETEDLLRAQQRRLIAMPTAVAALHSQQIEQARLFLRQAEDALKTLDVDGARTLATKAKVLLDEILR